MGERREHDAGADGGPLSMSGTLKDRLEYGAAVAARGVVHVLPEPASRALGTGIGLAFYGVDRRHRQVAAAQLAAAFPSRPAAECRRIARRTFGHFGRMLVATLRAGTLTPEALRSRVDVTGGEHVQHALSAGRGVIVFSGHFGYWEIQGLLHPLLFAPMSLLARPLDNVYLHDMVEAMRCATGNQVIYRQGAMRKVLRTLQANGCVAMLIDQHIHGADAVPVDFFSRPAATTTALAALALRTGARLVPAFALPLTGGRYRLIYEPPVEPPPADSPDPIRDLTQRCSDVLEMYVRRYPDLWLWMHRRWRTVPSADADRGMFPSAANERGSIEG
jgi:KDO2-lipid IV(A) lauroyltransferase